MKPAAVAAFSAILSLFAVSTAIAQTVPAPVERREMGNQVLEDVPEIPQAVRDSINRYQNVRDATFEDWMPDGSILIVTRFGATKQLHEVAAPGAARQQLTFFDEPVAEGQAVPGTRGAYVFQKDRGGDEWFQYHLADGRGRDVQLTEPGTRNESLKFSPDSKTMVWTRQVKGSTGSEILAASLAGGQPRTVLKDEGSYEVLDVSPDGRTALIGRYWSIEESRRWLLDLATERLTEINPSKAKIAYGGGAFTPDGKSVLVITNEGSDIARLVDINLANGKKTVLTPDAKWGVENFDLSKDGRLLAYATNEEGYSRLTLVDRVTRRALPQPELPMGVLTGMKFSPDGAKLALSLTTPTSAGDVWTWDVTAARLDRWTFSEMGGLNPAFLSTPDLVRYKSFDGRSIPAFVYRPKISRAGKLPVIIDIHGGPESQARPIFDPIVQHEANELGAAVIRTNVRGSDGYGKAYLALDNAGMREDSVKDIGALLDWIAAQPDLDPTRVVVYGQSYGGYMSLAVMTHYSDRLAGGIERYGISNFETFLQNTEAYRRNQRRAEYGDERDPKMLALFRRISPIHNVAKITKPMVVMQGANDPRVPPSESEQIVRTLRANGVPTWYVLFKDEGHGFQKKPNNDLRRAVETVFMQKMLGIETLGSPER
ncbi:MAG: S9 family peptidase [Caulobacteraceae bacterium]